MWSVGCIYAELVETLNPAGPRRTRSGRISPLFPGNTSFLSDPRGATAHAETSQLAAIFKIIGTPTAAECAAIKNEIMRGKVSAWPAIPCTPFEKVFAKTHEHSGESCGGGAAASAEGTGSNDLRSAVAESTDSPSSQKVDGCDSASTSFICDEDIAILEATLRFDPAKRATIAKLLALPCFDGLRDPAVETTAGSAINFPFEDAPPMHTDSKPRQQAWVRSQIEKELELFYKTPAEK